MEGIHAISAAAINRRPPPCDQAGENLADRVEIPALLRGQMDRYR
jgi:hypothetical protein